MNIIFWNIGKFGRDNKYLLRKGHLIRELIRSEKPDIICFSEGTPSKKHEILLKKLLEIEHYYPFYHPSMVLDQDGFEFSSFEPFGLKVFLSSEKNNIQLDTTSVLFKGRLIRMNIGDFLLIFIHRNQSASNHDQNEFISQIKTWVRKRLKDKIKSAFIVGDFNLKVWDEHYFSENSNYLRSSFLKQLYDLRERQNDGLNFFNPVVETLIKKNEQNLGGTFFSKKKIGWHILDYVLIENFDATKTKFDILTRFGSENLLSNQASTNEYLLHGIDHLPIKLQIT